MGSHSTQRLAIVLFIAAFQLLGRALSVGGSVLFFVLFVIVLGASVALFRRAKPLEHSGE